MRRRFFVEQFVGDTAALEGGAAHHLGKVLRAETGQLYELSDGNSVRLGRVEKVARDRIEFALEEPIPSRPEQMETTLLLSIVKFDRFEWAIEKGTELGVTAIVPLAAARSEKALVAAAPKRAERWHKIVIEAAQQARRLRPPKLYPLIGGIDEFETTAGNLRQSGGPKIILSERENAPPLRSILEKIPRETVHSSILAIGPEGGWTDQEFAQAGASGFVEASLGANILRTETAVVAALAAINYVFA